MYIQIATKTPVVKVHVLSSIINKQKKAFIPIKTQLQTKYSPLVSRNV